MLLFVEMFGDHSKDKVTHVILLLELSSLSDERMRYGAGTCPTFVAHKQVDSLDIPRQLDKET